MFPFSYFCLIHTSLALDFLRPLLLTTKSPVFSFKKHSLLNLETDAIRDADTYRSCKKFMHILLGKATLEETLNSSLKI